MTIAASHLQSRAPLRAALGMAVVVTLGIALGAAFGWRGPDAANQAMPDMADRAVILPDGSGLYVQRHEVTVAEWNTCFRQGACSMDLRARAHQDPAKMPATGLSHVDAQDYVRWINAATGHDFRLPSLAEWTHMARSVLPEDADPLFTDPSLAWASAYLTEGIAPRALKPQGSSSVTAEGIADLDGSVWEWTQECYVAAADGVDATRCPAYYVGGVHIAAMFYLERDPARGGCAVGSPPAHLGLRLVSDAAF